MVFEDLVSSVVGFIEGWGWFIVIGVLVFGYLINRLQTNYRNSLPAAQSRVDDFYKKYDTDEILKRQEEMMKARQRLQEKYDADADVFKAKQKELEEKKRQQQIEEWENFQKGGSYRSKAHFAEEPKSSATKVNSTKPKKPSVRYDDFNPLMGGGGSSGYRPARRGMGGSGGG